MYMHVLTPDRYEPRHDASLDASSPGSNTFDTLEIKAMNIRRNHRSFSVYLTAAALLAASAAHASDDRLWREQIPAAPLLASLTLAPVTTDAAAPAAEWFWRDQVSAPHAFPVYVARSTGESEASAEALWREQHRPAGASQKPIRIVSEPRHR